MVFVLAHCCPILFVLATGKIKRSAGAASSRESSRGLPRDVEAGKDSHCQVSRERCRAGQMVTSIDRAHGYHLSGLHYAVQTSIKHTKTQFGEVDLPAIVINQLKTYKYGAEIWCRKYGAVKYGAGH